MTQSGFADNFMRSIPVKQGVFFEETRANLESRLMQLESFLQEFVGYGNVDISQRFQDYFGETAAFSLRSATNVTYEEISPGSRPEEIARIHIAGKVPVEMQFGGQNQGFSLNLIYQSDFRYARPPDDMLHTEFSANINGKRHFIDSFSISDNRKKSYKQISDRMIPYVVEQYFPDVLDDVHKFARHFYAKIGEQLSTFGYAVTSPSFNLTWSSLRYDSERDLCFFEEEFKHHADGKINISDKGKNTRISYHVPYPTFRFRKGELIIYPGTFDGSNLELSQLKFDPKGWMIGGSLGQAYGKTDGFELLPDRSLPFENRMLYRGPMLQLPKNI